MLIACVLYIVANAVPAWNKGSVSGNEYKVGLWKTCITPPSSARTCTDTTCSSGDNNCNKLLTSRAFVTLACILSCIAALCLFASAVIKDDMKRIIFLVGEGLGGACFIAGIIGVAIGITVTRDLGTGTEPSDLRSAETLFSLDASGVLGILADTATLLGFIIPLVHKLLE